MSIASEITRLQNAKSSIKTAIENKGVSVPSSAKLDSFNTYVSQIIQGGGIELNLSYGQSAPTDTTKLWAKCNTPTLVKSENVFNGAYNNCSIETSSATLPVALSNTSSSAVGTNCYIFGGYSGSRVNTIYKFDTLTNQVTQVATLPVVLSNTSSSAVGTNCYIFGGNSGSHVNTIYKFNSIIELEENILMLINGYDTTPLPLINSDDATIDVSIHNAYIGNSQDLAESVEIYQYISNAWTRVV